MPTYELPELEEKAESDVDRRHSMDAPVIHSNGFFNLVQKKDRVQISIQVFKEKRRRWNTIRWKWDPKFSFGGRNYVRMPKKLPT